MVLGIEWNGMDAQLDSFAKSNEMNLMKLSSAVS